MTSIRRTACSAIACAAALGLTACNDSDIAVSSASSSSSTSSSSAAPSTSSSSSTSPSTSSSSAAAAPGTSDSGKPATKGSVKDKTAIPTEQISIPAGPVTAITVKLLGGYVNGNDFGEFYTALDVTSTTPGLLSIQYVMLDASGKALKTVDDSISVAGTAHELKVTRALGSLPPASQGKVAKVRLVVKENSKNEFATVTQIEGGAVQIGRNASTDSATVSGRYRTIGKASVISMKAICVDAAGVVQTADSPVDKISAPQWTPFTVNFFSAKPGFTPKSCYVGS